MKSRIGEQPRSANTGRTRVDNEGVDRVGLSSKRSQKKRVILRRGLHRLARVRRLAVNIRDACLPTSQCPKLILSVYNQVV